MTPRLLTKRRFRGVRLYQFADEEPVLLTNGNWLVEKQACHNVAGIDRALQRLIGLDDVSGSWGAAYRYRSGRWSLQFERPPDSTKAHMVRRQLAQAAEDPGEPLRRTSRNIESEVTGALLGAVFELGNREITLPYEPAEHARARFELRWPLDAEHPGVPVRLCLGAGSTRRVVGLLTGWAR